MDSGYCAACAGLRAKSQALEVVANNVANLNSTGYASAQVDKKKIGQLAVAIQTAFQQMGLFPGAGTGLPIPSGANEPLTDNQKPEINRIVYQDKLLSILKLVPSGAAQIDPVVFWEHSLGCALVCRHFARKINFNNPEKAYLGGLLHDLGIIVNLWILPKKFGLALELAKSRQMPLYEAELEVLGLTHCESEKFWLSDGL